MDPSAIFERADVTHRPGDLLPGGSDEATWVAIDPETGCRGVGRFEEAARTNLVYAVEAYHENRDQSVPFISSGSDEAFEMRWLRESDSDAPLTTRILTILPF